MWSHVIMRRMHVNRSHHTPPVIYAISRWAFTAGACRCLRDMATSGSMLPRRSVPLFVRVLRGGAGRLGPALALHTHQSAVHQRHSISDHCSKRRCTEQARWADSGLQAMAHAHIPAWLLRSCLPPLLCRGNRHATSPSRGCPPPSCIQCQPCTHRFRKHAETCALSHALSLCRPHTVFQVVYPFGKCPQSSGVVDVLSRIWLSLPRIPSLHIQLPCQPLARVMSASKPYMSLIIHSCALSLLHGVRQRHSTCMCQLP